MLLNRLYDYIRLITALLAPATSWKIGNGRKTTTDGNAIFKTNMKDNEDVDTVDTGFGSRKPTPEQRIVSVEREVEGWCCFDFFGDRWFEVLGKLSFVRVLESWIVVFVMTLFCVVMTCCSCDFHYGGVCYARGV